MGDASKPDEPPFVNGGHDGVVAFLVWRKPSWLDVTG
jgi:hypothetical protein